MKHLIFALLLISASVTGQTADYSIDGRHSIATDNQTLFYDIGADTLTGTNDTLLITFDRTFPAYYNGAFVCTVGPNTTSITGMIEVVCRNKSSEEWLAQNTTTIDEPGTFTLEIEPIYYMQMGIRVRSETGDLHINTSLCLKRL